MKGSFHLGWEILDSPVVLFTKQEAKLVTYAAGPVKSTADYIMVRQEDKAKICNVKVITSEECVGSCCTLVTEMLLKAEFNISEQMCEMLYSMYHLSC